MTSRSARSTTPILLIVDDEPLNRDTHGKIFTDAGYAVDATSTVSEALESLERRPPDIVLLDVSLGNESGYDLLDRIKSDQRYRDVYVVMITGYRTSPDDQSDGLERGADGFLTRPIDSRELVARVDAFVRHKVALDSLRKSEEQFRRIVERNPDAMLVIDESGVIRFANPAASELFQMANDELVDHPFGYPVVAGDYAEVQIVGRPDPRIDAQMRTERIEWRGDTAVLTSIRGVRDAELRTVEIEFDGDSGLLTSIRDVSKRKRAERLLRSEEKLHRATLQSIGEGIIATDIEGKVTRMNPVAERYTGWDGDRARGMPVEDVFRIHYGDDDLSAAKDYKTGLSTGIPDDPRNTARLVARGGQEYVVSMSAAPIHGESDDVLGTVIAFRDVTLQYQLHEDLERSERRFRALIDHAPDGIVVVSTDGSFRYASPSALRTFGYTEDEILAHEPAELTHPEDLPEVLNVLQRVARSAPTATITHEYRFRKGTGEWVWIESTFSNHANTSGIEGIIINFRDISERRAARTRIEDDLEEKKVLLRELYHRTKNNMQVISAMLNLRIDSVKDSATRSVLADLDHRIMAMALVHQHLYESSRLSHIDLHGYLTQLSDLLEKSVSSDSLRVEIAVTCDPLEAVIDVAIPLGQIISEFVSNSAKHAFVGMPSGRIVLSGRKLSDGGFRVEYRDDGVGMPSGFDVTRDGNLGMETVRSLAVHQLRGTFTSEPSTQGAIFVLEIPATTYGARV